MLYEFKDGRIYLTRTPEERAPLLNRLSRIEGQVRGLRQMIEDDRYCGDEIQQSNAVTAALREVALLLIAQHLDAGLECAMQADLKAAAVVDILALLRKAVKL